MSVLARNTAGLSRLAWTSGIVIGASLPHWTSLPLWMPFALLACVAWRFAARILGWPLPGRWSMRLMTIAAIALVLIEFGTINGLVPGSALLVVMVSLKFLEARSQRDHIILTVIAYFLVFASVLAGGSLLKGLYLLAFVWITTLGLLQVGREGPLLSSRPTALLSGRLLLQSMPLMVALFLLFPRLPGPLWSLPGDDTSGITGLTGSMSPGDITSLGLSDAIAFRVDFDGRPPAASDLYWRGPVLTSFDGRAWRRPSAMRGGSAQGTIEYVGDPSRYRVTLEPGARDWIFVLEMPERWSLVDERRIRTEIAMDSNYQLGIWPREAAPRHLRYEATSYSRYVAREALDERDRQFFTTLPPDQNPRTRALVESFLADSPDAGTLIERALGVFEAEGYFYTLTPPPLGEHSVDEFIFETREGFCEHYASAFAIMMRMAGLPARVVTGYQGGELNPMGEYYIVRQSNAHAWTEVWLPDEGWRRVDPIAAVAPERIALGSTQTGFAGQGTLAQRIGRMTLLRQAALAWDAVNRVWDQWVVGYGPRLQDRLLEWLGFDRVSFGELALLAVAATAVAMAALTLGLDLRRRRWQSRDPAAQSFERFARKLRRRRVGPLEPGETPRAYAERAGAELPEDRDAIARITAAYLAARYEPDRDGAALDRLRALVRAFRPGYARASR